MPQVHRMNLHYFRLSEDGHWTHHIPATAIVAEEGVSSEKLAVETHRIPSARREQHMDPGTEVPVGADEGGCNGSSALVVSVYAFSSSSYNTASVRCRTTRSAPLLPLTHWH